MCDSSIQVSHLDTIMHTTTGRMQVLTHYFMQKTQPATD